MLSLGAGVLQACLTEHSTIVKPCSGLRLLVLRTKLLYFQGALNQNKRQSWQNFPEGQNFSSYPQFSVTINQNVAEIWWIWFWNAFVLSVRSLIWIKCTPRSLLCHFTVLHMTLCVLLSVDIFCFGVLDYIQPVCLPTYGQRLADGQMGTVTGWGNVEYYG